VDGIPEEWLVVTCIFWAYISKPLLKFSAADTRIVVDVEWLVNIDGFVSG
jgi:hypothetical protein